MATRRSAGNRPAKRRTLKICSGDRVQVMSGKDRGKTGRVLRVDPKRERLYVEGLNMIKRHIRPDSQNTSPVIGSGAQQQLGGVIELEGSIHVSNVMLLDAKGQPTRVRIEREDGRRVRVAKSTGARID
jgi:large subunit ribosomal protein L24